MECSGRRKGLRTHRQRELERVGGRVILSKLFCEDGGHTVRIKKGTQLLCPLPLYLENCCDLEELP